MESKLFFGILADYDVTRNELLKERAAIRFWDPGRKRYVCIFNLEVYDDVVSVMGNPVDFDELDVRMMASRCPGLRDDFVTEPYKGIGSLEVVVYPKVIKVYSWINKRQAVHEIPIETIECLWRVLKKKELAKRFRTRAIAEAYCQEMGFERFFRESGSFDFAKFFGNRKDYIPMNLMLNVLRSWGLINYERSGHVTRIAEEIGLQARINCSE